MSTSTGVLDDPVWRRERARKAGLARTTTDYLVAQIVERAPQLTDEQAAFLAGILAGRGKAGRR
jgi:hypothetical protein